MSPLGLALAILPLGIVFIVLSLIKTALRTLSKVTLRRLADEAAPAGTRHLVRFLDNPVEVILELQSLIQLSLIGMAVLGTLAIARAGVRWPVLVALAVLGLAVLAFEHFFPRFVMSAEREKLLLRLLPAWRLLEPLGSALSWPVASLYRLAFEARPGVAPNDGVVSEEEVRAFIDVGEEAGILDEAEGKLIESVVDFGDTLVREVMTPSVDMVRIEAGRTIGELRDLFIETRHSRIPVYRDRPDNIEGTVYIKDLLEAWRDGREADPVSAWMKPAVFVPEIKKVASLLKELQRNRVSFAIAVDEFGTPSGLVTIEQLIEEIVGEIKEEHEEEAPEAVEQADGAWLVSGKAHVQRLESIFDVSLPEADYDTVAGLVFASLGRVPSAGEEFVHGGLKVRVVEADRRRVHQVLVRRAGNGSRT